jgi:hypothetical protein
MYAVNAAKSEQGFYEKKDCLANDPTADVSYLWVLNGSEPQVVGKRDDVSPRWGRSRKVILCRFMTVVACITDCELWKAR